MTIKLNSKLIMTHLTVGLLSLMLTGGVFWFIASHGLNKVGEQSGVALELAAYHQLKSVRTVKSKQVTDFFTGVHNQLHMVKDNPATRQAFKDFNQVVEKDSHFMASKRWLEVAQVHDAWFKDLCHDFQWYDVFLINAEGRIIYTTRRAADLGLFIDRSPLQRSALGKAFAQLRENPELDFTFGDFVAYPPANNTPEAFLFSTIEDGGVAIGYVALQMSRKAIQRMMSMGSYKQQALDVYLVGLDGYMRSDSVLSPEDYSVVASFNHGNKISTLAMKNILEGKAGASIITGYLDRPVLSAWKPIDLLGTRWGLICEIDEAVAMEAKVLVAETRHRAQRQLLTWAVLISMAIGLLVTLGAFFIARTISKPLSRAAAIANGIAAGDFDQRLNMQRYDEVGQLADALDSMANALCKSFKHKSGIAGLADQMQGELSIPMLAQKVVNYLACHLDAQMASLYLADKKGECFVLTGSYAFAKKQAGQQQFKLGQGIAGQAALEQRIISVTEVPGDYLCISSTLGDSLPGCILAVPFIYKNKVVGVLEFAAFKQFPEAEKVFLAEVVNNVAIAFHATMNHWKIQKLLEETQRQSSTLESQSRELHEKQAQLKVSNEELVQQSEELQVSNEELVQQAEELEVSNEELEEKTNMLERQAVELEQKRMEVENVKHGLELKAKELELTNRFKSEFLANMSHELRTPLNSLLILAKILADNDEGNLTTEQIKSAGIVYKGGQDLLFLINEILDLSKIEAGMLEVHDEEVSLENIARNMEQQFLPGAERKGLAFNWHVASGLPTRMVTDGQRLEQILKNFLSNAFKFTTTGMVKLDIIQPDADIRFRSNHLDHNQTVAFSVQDTGTGIALEKQALIFEAFQQADGSTSRLYGGTGLGLSIARSLAHLLNGEIQLTSKVGSGSVFTLFLPLKQAATQEETANDVLMVKQATAQPLQVPKTSPVAQKTPIFLPDDQHDIKEGDKIILVIEDDREFGQILMEKIREKGFKCLVAGDGSRGLELVRGQRPDAIILDLGLPDIDGTVLLDNLKFDLATRHIPIHVMSARDKVSDIMKKGIVGYLTKPINAKAIDQALSRIESLLHSSIKNVLVIEDDANSRQAIETLLAAEKVQITGVDSGQAAIKLIAEGNFDCVILDLGLPDMTGFELLHHLDVNLSDSLPPIIIYTGKELTSEELRALAKYTANVVVKGANSPERLLSETSLFLHMIESSFPPAQKKMLHTLHDPPQQLPGRKILLVDDDLRNSFALSKVLKQAGVTVVMAENGQVALNMLEKEEKIELVLMDIMMPVMDGYQAMGKIRGDHRFHNLPIIALTAKAMVEDREKCIDAGANDYLSKPIDTEKLLSLMRVLLYQ